MNRRHAPLRYLLLFSAWLLAPIFTSPPSMAGDWPQILGPNRNGIAVSEKLADSWPAGVPPVVWKSSVGSGLAGPVVAADRLYLFHRRDAFDLVTALKADDGEALWETRFATQFSPSINPDDGPRACPVFDQGRLYVYSAQGVLAALECAKGEVLWSRQTHRDFDASEGYFGAGSSPLVLDGRVIVNVGGARKNAGIVAFDARTGKTLWTSLADTASYSSPVAVTIGEKAYVLMVTRLNAVLVEPSTGEIRFRLPFGQRGPTVNGANPIVMDDRFLLSAAYGIGALFAQFDQSQANVLWKSDDLLSSQYTTGVVNSGMVYGIHGRDDVGVAELRCIDPLNKKVQWSLPGFGYATLIAADGKLLAWTTSGELVLVALDSQRYRELARAKIFSATTRALPALANGRLYIRDTDTLKCVDLR